MKLKSKKRKFWKTLAEHSLTDFDGSPISYAYLFFEWIYYGYPYPKNIISFLKERGYALINKQENKCVCSTNIKYRYIIVNPQTMKIAIIGSCCKEKFFTPTPKSVKATLTVALSELRNKADILRTFGIRDKKIEYLLGTTIYYIEKNTKYKRLIVTKRYVDTLKEVLGMEWFGKIWTNEEDKH